MSTPYAIRHKSSIFLLAPLVLLATALLFAASGDVDPSFVPNIGGPVYESVMQPDGKMVIGGSFTTVDGASRIILARLNADGSNDPSFTSPFVDDFNNQVLSLAVQTDGKILVGGLMNTPSGFQTLVRVTATGLLDPAFAAPPGFGQVRKVVVRASDGQIFSADTASTGVNILNADGSFVGKTASFLNFVHSFVVQPDGNVVAAGTGGGVDRILRCSPDDECDRTFNDGNAINTASVTDLELLADGRILAAGSLLDSERATRLRFGIFRLLPTGVFDASFDAPIDSVGAGVTDLAVQADGKIVAAGSFRTAGEAILHGYARFEADGAVDTTFAVEAPDVNAQMYRSVDIQPDGRILVAGDFLHIGPIARTFIARLFDGGSNSAPVLSNVAVTSPINENGIATLSGNISDANAADTFTLTVNWGDGFAAQVFTYPAGTTSFGVQRQYQDDNPTGTSSDAYAIALTLGDSGGGSDTDSASVTVNNLAPSLSGVAAAPPTLTVGGTTTVSGTVADTGTLDPHTITIAWGDGSANTTIPLAAGVTTFGSTHQYNASGAFTVGVTAADDDLGSTNGSTSVTVNPLGVVPNAPTNLTASAVSKTQINLAWVDHANNEAGFAIERCTPQGTKCTFAEIARTGANATAFANLGLAGNKEYRYRVRAFNAAGNSAYTTIAIAKTPKK